MKHLITVMILLGAIAAYFVGWGQGVAVLVALGLVLEGVLWMRVLRAWRGRKILGAGEPSR